jgi:hypothetical protein
MGVCMAVAKSNPIREWISKVMVRRASTTESKVCLSATEHRDHGEGNYGPWVPMEFFVPHLLGYYECCDRFL